MQYRNATIDDLPLIVEIYNSTIPSRLATADTEPVPVESRVGWFHAHNPETRPLWMIEADGEIIGWVSFNNFYGRPAYDGTAELSIYLSPLARGKGYGKKILQYCIEQCPALQIENLLGFIFSHNQPSITLFEQAGFTLWGLLKEIAVMDGNKYSLSIYGIKIN
ncbi:MAG: GNAT family N-acetyltransferase [Ferruginibacter sp.]